MSYSHPGHIPLDLRHYWYFDCEEKMNTIVIHNYDPRWPAEYEGIANRLERVLGDEALRIDHIGSTSVPGLGAKDVIDVQVTVEQLSDAQRDAMVMAGYQQVAVARDHIPPGGGEDLTQWVKLLFVQRAGERRANIHIRQLGLPNQRYALLFRDYLRAHPAAASVIEEIKRALARLHPRNLDAYYNIKDPVNDLVWIAAQEWAAQTGWAQIDLIPAPTEDAMAASD